jgi:hypothetical protein
MTAARSPVSTMAWFAVPGQPSKPVEFGYHAVLDGRAVISRLAAELPPIAADLMEIAATVFAVDQQVPRPRGRDLDIHSTWAREIQVEIPVRLPELWHEHGGRLANLLAWLTDDIWVLTFTARSGALGPLDASQGFLFDAIPDGAVPVLFSGGLDSGVGLATYLEEADAVAVSVDTNNWMQHVLASRPPGRCGMIACRCSRTASARSTFRTCARSSVPRQPRRCTRGPCTWRRAWPPQSAATRSESTPRG